MSQRHMMLIGPINCAQFDFSLFSQFISLQQIGKVCGCVAVVFVFFAFSAWHSRTARHPTCKSSALTIPKPKVFLWGSTWIRMKSDLLIQKMNVSVVAVDVLFTRVIALFLHRSCAPHLAAVHSRQSSWSVAEERQWQCEQPICWSAYQHPGCQL